MWPSNGLDELPYSSTKKLCELCNDGPRGRVMGLVRKEFSRVWDSEHYVNRTDSMLEAGISPTESVERFLGNHIRNEGEAHYVNRTDSMLEAGISPTEFIARAASAGYKWRRSDKKTFEINQSSLTSRAYLVRHHKFNHDQRLSTTPRRDPFDKPNLSTGIGGMVTTGLLQAIALGISGASSLIIRSYYEASTKRRLRDKPFLAFYALREEELRLALKRNMSIAGYAYIYHWYRMFYDDPTPLGFLAACAGYGIGMSVLLYFRRHDKHQKTFLAGGLVTAFIVGLAFGKDVRGVLMEIAPMFVVVALLLSIGFHWIMV
ncbi:MAG: hypothetical protein M1816_005201 [Peltula sp. TS41687]|nr:MAG: hypothetical protein M1816_005201 [Peltula sp. TS41687]